MCCGLLLMACLPLVALAEVYADAGVIPLPSAQLWLGPTPPQTSTATPIAVTFPDYWPIARRQQSHQGWYRFNVVLPERNAQWALLLPNLSGRATVYWDGQHLGQSLPLTGVGTPVVAGPLMLTLPAQLAAPGSHQLDVQFIGRISQLSFLREPIIAPQDMAQSIYVRKSVLLVYLPVALSLISLVIALVFFAAYRKDPAGAGFSWLAMGLIASTLSVLGLYLSLPETISFITSRIRPSLFHLSFVCFLLAITRMQAKPIDWGTKGVLAVSAVLFSAVLVAPEIRVNQISALWVMLSYGIGLYLLVQVTRLALAPPRRWINLLPLGLVPVFIVHDWVGVLNRGEFWADQMLGIYNSALFAFALMMVLVVRSKQNAGELLVLNQELEARVEAKHRELQTNFERLTEAQRREAVLSERERMVREMHDGLGGQLVSTLAMVESGRFSEQEIEAALRDSLDDLRMMVHSLDLEETELIDLLALVRERVEPRLQRQGISLHWHVGDLSAAQVLSPEQAGHVLRVVQESLTNILKHARARNIALSVDIQDGRYVIEIADDGCGMAEAAGSSAGGMGLKNMRSRAALLGGEVCVSPQSDGPGTVVRLAVPVGKV